LKPDSGSHAVNHSGDNLEIVSCSEGSVEVHQVDPAGALFDKAFGHCDRVIPINGLPRRLALTEANDAAGSNINGGKEVHYKGYGNHRVGDSTI
jgi:hypothetical protein